MLNPKKPYFTGFTEFKKSKNSIFLFDSSSGEDVIIMLKGKNLSNSKGFRVSTKYETKKSDIIDKSIIDRRL